MYPSYHIFFEWACHYSTSCRPCRSTLLSHHDVLPHAPHHCHQSSERCMTCTPAACVRNEWSCLGCSRALMPNKFRRGYAPRWCAESYVREPNMSPMSSIIMTRRICLVRYTAPATNDKGHSHHIGPPTHCEQQSGGKPSRPTCPELHLYIKRAYSTIRSMPRDAPEVASATNVAERKQLAFFRRTRPRKEATFFHKIETMLSLRVASQSVTPNRRP